MHYLFVAGRRGRRPLQTIRRASPGRRPLRKFPRPLGEGRVRVIISYNNHALTGRRGRRPLRKFPRPSGEGRVRVIFADLNHTFTGRRGRRPQR